MSAAAAHELKRDLDAGNLLVPLLGHGGAFIWRRAAADLFTLDDVSASATPAAIRWSWR